MRFTRKIKMFLVAGAVTAIGGGVIAVHSAGAVSPGPITNLTSNECLQPVAASFPGHTVDINANGNPIEQVGCTGAPEQKWASVYLFSAHDPLVCTGFDCPATFPMPVYYMVNSVTGKCMDVTNGGGANGVLIQQWDCNGGDSEKWAVERGIAGFPNYVNWRSHKCLDVPNNTFAQVIMQQYSCSGNNNGAQMFTFPA